MFCVVAWRCHTHRSLISEKTDECHWLSTNYSQVICIHMSWYDVRIGRVNHISDSEKYSMANWWKNVEVSCINTCIHIGLLLLYMIYAYILYIKNLLDSKIFWNFKKYMWFVINNNNKAVCVSYFYYIHYNIPWSSAYWSHVTVSGTR